MARKRNVRTPNRSNPVRFDPDTHRYFVGDREVAYPTLIMKEAGLLGSVSAFFTPEARDRGTRVHRACEAWDRGEPATLPDEEQGYLKSYTEWLALVGDVKWTIIETPGYSEKYDIAGTADRIGFLAGQPVVLDLKSGGPASWHGLQLAFYDLIFSDQKTPPLMRRRIVLYLQQSGNTAQSVTYTDFADYQTVMRLLNARKETHGKHRARRTNAD
jgi:hypothetical protein